MSLLGLMFRAPLQPRFREGDRVVCDLGVCTVVWPRVPTGTYVHLRDAEGRGWLREEDELRPAREGKDG